MDEELNNGAEQDIVAQHKVPEYIWKMAKKMLEGANLPTEFKLPAEAEVKHCQFEEWKYTDVSLPGKEGSITFRGWLDEMPPLTVDWQISRITVSGKVFAKLEFCWGENDRFNPLGRNILVAGASGNGPLWDLFDWRERLIGELGPLEQIMPPGEAFSQELARAIDITGIRDDFLLREHVVIIRERLIEALRVLVEK